MSTDTAPGAVIGAQPGRIAAGSRQYVWMSASLEQLLLTIWQRGQRLAARHQRTLDAAIAAAIAVASLVGLAIQHRLHHVDTVVFCACLPAPLVLGRRAPSLTFALVAGVCLLQWLTSTPQLANAAVLVALYWVAVDRGLGELLGAAAVTEGGAVMAAVRWTPGAPDKAWAALTSLTVAAAVLGVTVRLRRALVDSLHEKAARLEFERDQEGRLGAAAERARIAREMHDIVAHNLTVMVSLADGAAYVMDADPEQARPAIDRVSATGRQALEEMRRLLGVLREAPEDQPREPQPTLKRLDELVARVDAAGIPVSLEVDGEPLRLADGLQVAVFRIAQEALTNTLKHAGRPATAHVALRCAAEQVELEITDTGRRRNGGDSGDSGDSVRAATGRGLRGMHERAAAYGGELEAGPLADGGWRVRLRLHPEPAERA
jgi:signal transduction histidine kinase